MILPQQLLETGLSVITQRQSAADGDGNGSGADTDAGASGGDSSSFNLSEGGIAAIIVIVVLVAIFGIATTVLYVMAKRRQWTMRETLRRASRRFTGRGGDDRRRTEHVRLDRQSKREGLQMSSRPETRKPKTGFVVGVDEAEKGQKSHDGRQIRNATENESWKSKLLRNDWKR